MKSIIEIFKVALYLGLTSFGGPVAHLGYFHKEYVEKRNWLDSKSYADLVALCQFLPGPASSQVGIGVGLLRGGLIGGLVAWIGFTLPSAIALYFFSLYYETYNIKDSAAIHGLKIVAVAIVAHAVWTMGKKLVTDKKTALLAILSSCLVLLIPIAAIQVFVILASGLIGIFLFKTDDNPTQSQPIVTHHPAIAIVALLLFAILLFILPIIASTANIQSLHLFDGFFRSGALVFGGGHVVLPLLELEMVPTGLVDKDAFIAGYGAAQAVPGPLFTFASFLGAEAAGLKGSLLALIAIFTPAFLLVVGIMPFWERLRQNQRVKSALIGINAAVVGILLAALYKPIFLSSVLEPKDFVLAMVLYGMLAFLKLPSLVVVMTGALGGWLFAFLP